MTRMALRGVALAIGIIVMTGIAEAKLGSKEWRSLSKKARKALKRRDAGTVASLVAEVAGDDSVRAVELIGTLYKLDNASVYSACKDALASISEPAAVKHMALKLGKGGGSWTFRVLLADAFAQRSDDETMDALCKSLSDKRSEVARATIEAILSRRDKRAVSPLIDLLESLEKRKKGELIYNQVMDALVSLTGESLDAAVDWRNWWSIKKDSFAVPERPTTGKKAKKIEGTAERRPKFFGSELKSKRIVFVIDVSGSMQATDPAPSGGAPARPESGGGGGAAKPAPTSGSRVRIDRAKFQLSRAIEMLPKGTHFSVLAYNGALAAGQYPKKTDPIQPKVGGRQWLHIWSPKLMPSNAKSRKSAVDFVGGFKAEGGTFTFTALRMAFQIKGVDNIILLSDGAPNDYDGPTQMTPDQIVAEIKNINKFRRVRIDTFGFDPAGAGAAPAGRGSVPGGAGMANPLVEFLKKLAEQNSGKFTPIS